MLDIFLTESNNPIKAQKFEKKIEEHLESLQDLNEEALYLYKLKKNINSLKSGSFELY